MLRDKVREADPLIALSEVYESIQGEGLLVGVPAVFVRLKGCNLRCPWCDQPESLSFGEKDTPLSEVLRRVKSLTPKHAVITGGEPFAHGELPLLTEALLKEGYSVQIETNGTLWLEEMDELISKVYLSCSPKEEAGYGVREEVLKGADELKFVVEERLSLEVLLREEFRPFLEEERAVLQPESNRKEMATKALSLQRELLRMGYRVRVIPQAHKCLSLP